MSIAEPFSIFTNLVSFLTGVFPRSPATFLRHITAPNTTAITATAAKIKKAPDPNSPLEDVVLLVIVEAGMQLVLDVVGLAIAEARQVGTASCSHSGRSFWPAPSMAVFQYTAS